MPLGFQTFTQELMSMVTVSCALSLRRYAFMLVDL